jgi:cytoskeletal protein CcmA (bactofilin family)
MWKSRSDEKPAPPVSPSVPAPATAPLSVEKPRVSEPYRAEMAHIGKSVVVKGELSGSEDLYLDGEVEGSVELRGHSLIVGPNGRVRANVHARDVVVHGKVDGNIRGTDRVELKKSAILVGDVFTQRVIIEDGAFFKGAIDIQKDAPKTEPRPMAAVASTPAASTAAPQASMLDQKKL